MLRTDVEVPDEDWSGLGNKPSVNGFPVPVLPEAFNQICIVAAPSWDHFASVAYDRPVPYDGIAARVPMKYQHFCDHDCDGDSSYTILHDQTLCPSPRHPSHL